MLKEKRKRNKSKRGGKEENQKKKEKSQIEGKELWKGERGSFTYFILFDFMDIFIGGIEIA